MRMSLDKKKRLLTKYKQFIMYAVFGVLTTAVNFTSYYLCYNSIGIENIPATIIAWILAVIFAFLTNKLWVFDSKSFDKATITHEVLTFFWVRLITGVFDVVIMGMAVDVMEWDSTIWKLLSNVIVIVINYIMSRLIVFTGRKGR